MDPNAGEVRMKTIFALVLAAALGAFDVAHAQQAPYPVTGPMGPGMMTGMHQQMMGLSRWAG
jgi:hypothetical protein